MDQSILNNWKHACGRARTSGGIRNRGRPRFMSVDPISTWGTYLNSRNTRATKEPHTYNFLRLTRASGHWSTARLLDFELTGGRAILLLRNLTVRSDWSGLLNFSEYEVNFEAKNYRSPIF